MTLKKAIALLEEKYEEGKRNEYVRDPLAWALYQVWKKAEEGGGERWLKNSTRRW